MTARESWAMLKALQQIHARVEALTDEVKGLRTTIDTQSKQIAALQTDLSYLPAARRDSRAVHPPTYLHTYRITGSGRN
jgi:cell division protein FtsB